MSNYVTKSDLKSATGVGTSDFAKKTDLASLKCDVDKLDIDKLKNVPSNLSKLKSREGKLDLGKCEPTAIHLSKLGNVIKHDVIKNEYDELVEKVNAIQTTDTNNLVKKLTQELMKVKRITDHNHSNNYITT